MPPGPGSGAISEPADNQQHPEREQRSSRPRQVEKLPPLFARPHCCTCGCSARRRKTLAAGCGALPELACGRRARGSPDQSCVVRGRGLMAATVATVAYLGLEARARRSPGPAVRRACRPSSSSACPTRRSPKAASGCARRLSAIGLALPPKRITVNLSPADLPKEGSHYDLPIALGLLAAIGAADAETLADYRRGRRTEPRRADRRRRRACCSRRSMPRRSTRG